MAGVDVNLFSKYDKPDAQPEEMSGTIPFTPRGVIKEGSTWEPEQETSFGGMSLRMKVLREHIEGLYQKLYEETGQTPEAFHVDNFEIRDGKLYYRDKSTSLMIRGGKLRSVGEIVKILGKEGLCDSDFDIPVEGKVTAREEKSCLLRLR